MNIVCRNEFQPEELQTMRRYSRIITYKPAIKELWFRKDFLADEETMAYNHAFGGTISFPEEKWSLWYDRWLNDPEGKHYYRYLMDEASGDFVGEIACHLDEGSNRWMADIIIAAWCRGKGYGRKGLQLLCREARSFGIEELYDDIAIDNTAVRLFISEGFEEVGRTADCIILRKHLKE